MTIGCFSKRLKGTRIVVTEMYIVYLPFGCWKADEVLTHRRLLVGVKFTYLLEGWASRYYHYYYYYTATVP